MAVNEKQIIFKHIYRLFKTSTGYSKLSKVMASEKFITEKKI